MIFICMPGHIYSHKYILNKPVHVCILEFFILLSFGSWAKIIEDVPRGRGAWEKLETILYVPLKKIAMPCVLLKKFSGLQRHCSNFFVPSMPLPSVWALMPSNCRCEKTKMPLSVNISLIFFEHLNDFKWKNSKLESCRSCWDL